MSKQKYNRCRNSLKTVAAFHSWDMNYWNNKLTARRSRGLASSAQLVTSGLSTSSWQIKLLCTTLSLSKKNPCNGSCANRHWLTASVLSVSAGLSICSECEEEVQASQRDVSLLLLLLQRRSQRGSLWLPRNHARYAGDNFHMSCLKEQVYSEQTLGYTVLLTRTHRWRTKLS